MIILYNCSIHVDSNCAVNMLLQLLMSVYSLKMQKTY